MKSSTRTDSSGLPWGRGLACLALLATTGVAARAQAQNSADSERANLLFKRGKLAFNAGKYSDALRIYGEAWNLKKSPDIAANLAQTESELGRHRDAAEHYAFALAHLLPSSTDEQKAALAEGLEVEKKEIGSLRVTLEPADSALSIDERPLVVPPTGDVFVEPGEHRAVVSHEGYEANAQTVRISKGAVQVLWIRLQPESASAVTPSTRAVAAPPESPAAFAVTSPPLRPAAPPARSIVPVIVGGGLVAAGAAVGVVFWASGNSSQTSADALRAELGASNACGPGTPTARESECARLHQKNSDVDRARLLEIAGFAAAGAAALGSALYLLWPVSGSPAGNGWAPTLALAPGVGSFGVTGQF
jgi:tetratricopeptide (TPR) repeat protein